MATSTIALLLTVAFIQDIGLVRSCQFPMKWWGNWYQSGLGDVIITGSHISSKGYCVEHHLRSDFFVVENRDDNCHQCLLIIERHENILQYKEGYCIGPETMHSLCNNIRVEAVLYTLVREMSQPVPCPFQNAFEFYYNNNSGGLCRSPVSLAHQCATNRRFHFRFNRCPDRAYTLDKEVELECLATWKDRSELYLYGSFSSDPLSPKEDKYRCFMYSLLGSLVYLSMSADATCRGLRSSRDGPLTIELNADNYKWPTLSQCSYPSWLLNSSWRDLPGKHRLSSEEDKRNSLLLTNFRKTTFSASARVQDHVFAGYRCLRMDSDGEDLTVLSHVVEACQPRFQCIKIRKRQFNVIQFQKGNYVKDENYRCTQADFSLLLSDELLLAEDSWSGSCPFEGRFYSTLERTGCQLEASAGCANRSRLEITSSCQQRPVLQLRCLLWWKEDQNLYFLAQDIGRELSNRIVCYTIRQTGETTEIGQEKSCSKDLLNFTSGQTEVYSFQNYLDECPLETVQPEVSGVKTIDSSSDKLHPEHGYSHVSSEDFSKSNELSIRISRADSEHKQYLASALLLLSAVVVHRFSIILSR